VLLRRVEDSVAVPVSERPERSVPRGRYPSRKPRARSHTEPLPAPGHPTASPTDSLSFLSTPSRNVPSLAAPRKAPLPQPRAAFGFEAALSSKAWARTEGSFKSNFPQGHSAQRPSNSSSGRAFPSAILANLDSSVVTARGEARPHRLHPRILLSARGHFLGEGPHPKRLRGANKLAGRNAGRWQLRSTNVSAWGLSVCRAL
jgi:hypothetical protein